MTDAIEPDVPLLELLMRVQALREVIKDSDNSVSPLSANRVRKPDCFCDHCTDTTPSTKREEDTAAVEFAAQLRKEYSGPSWAFLYNEDGSLAERYVMMMKLHEVVVEMQDKDERGAWLLHMTLNFMRAIDLYSAATGLPFPLAFFLKEEVSAK